MTARPTGRYFYLRGDEKVVLKVQPRAEWAIAMFAKAFLILTPAHALLRNIPRWIPEASQLLPFVRYVDIGYGALLAIAALVAWRMWATSEYALTDSRIYARHGRLRTHVHFTTHDRITDIRYRQGPIDRLLGISRVSFATAGGDVTIIGVRDAIAIKETAEVARDAFLQSLLHTAGVERMKRSTSREAARDGVEAQTRAARPAPTAVVEQAGGESLPPLAPPPVWMGPRPDYIKSGDVPLWFGKPRSIAAVSAALPFAGLFAIVLFTSASGGAMLFGPPVVALLAVGAIALRFVQLGKMEYTVTDRRVYTRSGIVGTTVTQLTYDKITDITYRQDLLGRVLGYGGVIVNTAGSNQAPASMIGLQKPLEVKAEIEAARSRYLREEDA